MPIPTDELKDQIDKLADALHGFTDSQAALKDDVHGLRLEMTEGQAALKDDVHGLRLEMTEGQAALKEDIHGLGRDVMGEIHGLGTEMEGRRSDLAQSVAELRSEIRTTFSIVKWVVTILGGIGVMAMINGIWWAANISADLRYLSKEVRALEEGRSLKPATELPIQAPARK